MQHSRHASLTFIHHSMEPAHDRALTRRVPLAGPYFEVRDYLDYIDRKGVWDPKATTAMPQPYTAGVLRLGKGVACAALHLTLSKTFPVETLESQRFLTERLLIKCAACCT